MVDTKSDDIVKTLLNYTAVPTNGSGGSVVVVKANDLLDAALHIGDLKKRILKLTLALETIYSITEDVTIENIVRTEIDG